MKLIQISDTHLVPPGQGVWGFDPRARLQACIAHINGRHRDAAACIVTGDLADRGEPAAYQVLSELLAELQVPWHLMIGNHDDRDNFLRAFPDLPRDPAGFVQQSLATEAGRLILLDTHEAPTIGAGSFCAQRAQWLAAELAAAGDDPVYLFLHHPPFDIGSNFIDRIRLLDPSELIRVLDGRDNIRHLFFGHVHRPVSGSWRGIPFSSLRSTVHQVSLDPPAPNAKPFCAEAPTYASILIEPDRVIVHLQEYLADTGLPAEITRESLAGLR